MKKILIMITILLGLTFADTLQKDYAYVISAIGIKNVEGNVVWQSGSSNQLADGTYKLAPQVIIYDGKTEYVGAATPFTGCLNGKYYNSTGAPDGACFAGGVATSSQNGLMSAADKAKLDGINLSNYALASHTHDDRYYTESEIDTKLGNINVSSNHVNSLGSKTAESGNAESSVPGLSMQEVYNNGYPATYGNVINLNGNGDGQILVGWSGSSGAHAGIFVRSQRDVSDASWSPWAEIVTSARLVDMIYPVGSIYTTASGAYPGDLFGGGWTKIGTQLAISGNVVGNGYALGLTDNNSYGGLVLHHNPSRTAISPKAFGAGQGGWSDDIASLDRRAFGVPTKAQLGSNLYKSGLVVDAVNVNVWQRTS